MPATLKKKYLLRYCESSSRPVCCLGHSAICIFFMGMIGEYQFNCGTVMLHLAFVKKHTSVYWPKKSWHNTSAPWQFLLPRCNTRRGCTLNFFSLLSQSVGHLYSKVGSKSIFNLWQFNAKAEETPSDWIQNHHHEIDPCSAYFKHQRYILEQMFQTAHRSNY